jgi:hypothetical protein
MSNFRGTRGKWELAENEYGYYTSVRNLDDSRKICTSRVNNQNESNANLLLISKAPEMLEMLENIYTERINGGDFDTREVYRLIKEATEL